MRIRGTVLLLAFLSLLAGCMGMRFSPGISMTDKDYFMEPPYIAATPDGYNLRWRYGTSGSSFLPSYKAVNGRLLLGVSGKPTSDQLAGQYGSLPITCDICVHALQQGGAFWVEPNGRQVRLEVKRVLTAPHSQ